LFRLLLKVLNSEQAWDWLYGEFQRLDRFDVMTGLCDRAMTRRPQRSCRNGESCIESSDEPEIGRYGFNF